ncbi:MAG TPA: P-loop NTPase [Vulgatibacter sp.]|nr:P-loop NTPase [Vulgatibacter sp.]
MIYTRSRPKGSPPGRGKQLSVFGVVSGKGGVGKTTLATNLAVLAAKRGRRVLLVDTDLGFSNVDLMLGTAPRHHLDHLLLGSMPIREILESGPFGLVILSSGDGTHVRPRLDTESKVRLLAELDSLEKEIDLVIIDAPASLDDSQLFFLGSCQQAILLVTPEPASLYHALGVMKGLHHSGRLRDYLVVTTWTESEAEGRSIFEKLADLARRLQGVRVRYLGSIPFDQQVRRSVTAQRPIVDTFPLSPASQALRRLADSLLDVPPASVLDGGLRFLWNRLFLESSP